MLQLDARLGSITVDGDDLETAEMIQSGLHPTAGQVTTNTKDIQELTDRFSQLSDYDVKAEATLKFAVSSSNISPEDKEQLKKLHKPQSASLDTSSR